jgi:preprotein translocase subunit SecG
MKLIICIIILLLILSQTETENKLLKQTESNLATSNKGFSLIKQLTWVSITSYFIVSIV